MFASSRGARIAVVVVVSAALLPILGSCAAEVPAAEESGPIPTASIVAIDGRFEVEDGRSLALKCWGEGEPTVIYDAGTGTSGLRTLERSALLQVQELSETTRVCSYDRAGIGASDPAPDERPRTVDDLVDDLHALLQAAGVGPPYVLVGSSGGGFDVYHYAGRHPDEVVGIVMDDVPSPKADMPATEVPAWDSSDNPERMDYVLFEHQAAVERLPIPAIPVTVLWATNGQSATQADQDLWLEGSSNPTSSAVESAHDIMHNNPTAVADAIAGMLASIRG